MVVVEEVAPVLGTPPLALQGPHRLPASSTQRQPPASWRSGGGHARCIQQAPRRHQISLIHLRTWVGFGSLAHGREE
jgi:hypothetical protein